MKYLFSILFTAIITLTYSQCYELVWNDEFNYTGVPDATSWHNETGAGGWGNNELQYYTARSENCRVENGSLVIEALQESYLGSQYTSARMITYYDKKYWTYGKIEARIKLPYGQGIWPAFWTLGKSLFEGAGWPACGEIDIMELIGGGDGRDNKIYGTLHWSDASNNHAQYGGSYQLSTGIFADTFHVFTVEWNSTYIKWFIDGTQYHVIDITPSQLSELHQPQFIILNLAVGGNWPGVPDASTVFPQKMEVDYVRVYQQGAMPEIQGDNLVDSSSMNLEFKIYGTDSSAYNWTVPADAEIIDGQGTNKIHVNWGNSDGTVTCTLTTDCEEYNLEFPVQIDLHSGISQRKAENITIMPTLAVDRIFIDNIITDKQYSIWNCLGKSELTGIISPGYEIDITSLAPGAYFIQFPEDDAYLPTKFLKIENN